MGEDHTVTPKAAANGIGSESSFQPNFFAQVAGIAWRKLAYASNDFVTVPLLLLPTAAAIAAAALYKNQTISQISFINDLLTAGKVVLCCGHCCWY